MDEKDFQLEIEYWKARAIAAELKLSQTREQATDKWGTPETRCGRYIPGHHAGNCNLKAGHNGECEE